MAVTVILCLHALSTQRFLIFSFPDETTLLQRRFKIDVDGTLKALSEQEDTDGNMQITIEDNGPKVKDTLDPVEIRGPDVF